MYAGYLIRFRALNHTAVARYLELWTRGQFYRSWVTSMLRAGAQPNINATEYSSLPVALPPLEEQRAIAEVLDSVDEAIERAEEVIAATEQLRDALLHELLTRGLPGQHSEWKEVPGLGTIPASWTATHLGDVGKFINGRAFKPSDWTDSGLPIIRIQNLTSRDAPCNFFAGAFDEIHAVDDGDILISWSASIEVRNWDRGPGILNQHIFKAISDPRILNHTFMFYLLVASAHSLRRRVHGTTMQHVTKSTFNSTAIALPSLEEQRAIAGVLDSVDEAIELAREELDALRSAQNSISDALLTGRVRVDPRREVSHETAGKG